MGRQEVIAKWKGENAQGNGRKGEGALTQNLLVRTPSPDPADMEPCQCLRWTLFWWFFNREGGVRAGDPATARGGSTTEGSAAAVLPVEEGNEAAPADDPVGGVGCVCRWCSSFWRSRRSRIKPAAPYIMDGQA